MKPRFSRFLPAVLGSYIALTLGGHAAIQWWDTNGATTGSGNADGTWDGSTANWTTDASGASAAGAWVAGNTAEFAAGTDFTGTRIVTVSGTQSLAGIIVDSEVTNLTLTGGTLDFGASQGSINTSAWGTTTGKTFTINSVIAGSAGLTIASNGDLSASGGGNSSVTKLGGTNTFTGNVTITSGLVAYSSDAAFGNAANAIILNGGGLLDTTSGTGPTLTRAIQVQAGGGTIRLYGSTTTTFSGAITGSGNLNRTDGGTLNLTGSLSGYAGTYDNQGGTTVVNGTDAAGGNWKVSGGVMRIGANGINSAGSLTLNGGTLSSNAASGAGDRTLGNAVTVGGNVTLGDATNTGVLTFTGGVDLGAAARTLTTSSLVTISGAVSNGTLVKAGASTLTLTGTNTAAATVNAGTLVLDYGTNDTSKLGDASVLTLGGGTLSLANGSHGEVVGSTVLSASTASTITRPSGAATLSLGAITRNTGASLNLGSGGIASTSTATTASGAFGSWLTLGGNSLVTKDGGNNLIGVTYTDTAVAGTIADAAANHVRLTGASGTVSLGSTVTNAATVTQTATGAVTLDTTGKTLRLSGQGSVLAATGGGALTFGTAVNAGVLTAGGTDNTAGVLDFNTRGASISVNSTITNNGTGVVSLTKFGSNDLTLSGTNSYSGGTTLSGGVLRVRNNLALGTGALAVDANATLASASGGPFVNLGNAVGIASGTTLSVDSGFGPLILSGAITGTGGALTTTSSGVTTLAGTNTYTGVTTIGTGNQNIYSGIQIGYFGTTGSVGTGAVNFGGYGNNLIYTRTNAATMSNAITGAGNVVVKSGTLTLSGGSANTYSGDTVVQGGTLQLSVSNSQNIGSSRLLVYSGGTVTNTTTHVFGVGTSTNIQLLGGTFSAGNAEFYAGNLDLAGGTISGVNEFRNSGSRTINVIPSATASTIDLRYSINGTGTNTTTFLVNDGPVANDLVISKNIVSGTSVVKSGLGTLRSTTSTAHGYTGSTVLNAGSFILDYSASSLTSNMLNSGSAPTFAGGNLTIVGKASTANTQTLGATTLNAGGSSITLTPGSSGSVGLTLGTVTRNTGATLGLSLAAGSTLTASPTLTNGLLPYATVNGNDFATVSGGTISAYSGYINDDYSGTGTINTNVTAASPTPASFTVNSLSFRTAQANTLTLTGTNTAAALLVGSAVGGNATQITGGTLTAATAGGELVIHQNNTTAGGELTIASTIANNTSASSLTKAGAGTLILTGTNTYSGTTYLNGGLARFSTSANLGTGAITMGGGGLQWATGSTVDITSGRTVTIGAGGGTFDTNGNNVTLATAFGSGSSGTFVKNGTGTLTLSANNTNFTGSVVVNGGKLVGSINGSGGFGSTAGQSFIVNTGGTLEISSSANHSTANTRNFYVNGGTLQNTSGAALRMGNIWLNGGTLNTQNGASGSYTAMYLGTLQNNTQGANATVFVEGTTASQITTTGSSSNGIQLGPNVLFQVADVTGNANVDLTVSVALLNQSADQGSAAGALTKRGAGTMNITTQASYTGGTYVEQGVLNLTGGGGQFGTIRGIATVNTGAVLRLSTGDATGYDGTTRLSAINLLGGNLDVNTTSNQTLGSAVINMTGATITGIAGSNIDFFAGASGLNSFASSTTSVISGVTLAALRQGNTTFNVEQGTTASGIDLDIQSVIKPSASGDAVGGVLTKAGAGTVAFSGNNTFARDVNIAAGTLMVGNGGTSGTLGTGNVVNNATLTFNRSDSHTIANNISGTGVVRKIAAGTTILTGTNTYAGTTTITSGTLQIGSGSTTGSLGTGAVANNATLAFNRSNAMTVSNAIGGTGAVTHIGSGTTTLTGVNNYSGTTTVSSGTLRFNGNSSGATGAVSVASGATLGGTGSIGGAVSVTGTLAPGASVESFSTGAVAFNTGSTFAVELDSSVAVSSGADLLVANGNLDLSGVVTLTLTDLATLAPAAPFADGTVFSIVNYTGTWNGGYFTFSGDTLTEGEQFQALNNNWVINYQNATPGQNFTGDYVGGQFVTLTVVPEPGVALLGGLGVLLMFRRRRVA
ncbi:autotransporter-associated beta strand repeat-containing protein [Luteolibacter ambystomatis]|uniref:Autotransporter-associated beta strand repeat-containing protein n=1 Tax=Luteolibacter ambystomatis TaxID=2824561 RepID=A0A975J021_9BACT|nr:autotransporter-associated beta strand repeat-containing protein [Luteolibacter ambystomatis]QUE51345.1 autotransporter-associated beta strand repeat-containing protein [Luteolibacter ambystomatis]